MAGLCLENTPALKMFPAKVSFHWLRKWYFRVLAECRELSSWNIWLDRSKILSSVLVSKNDSEGIIPWHTHPLWGLHFWAAIVCNYLKCRIKKMVEAAGVEPARKVWFFFYIQEVRWGDVSFGDWLGTTPYLGKSEEFLRSSMLRYSRSLNFGQMEFVKDTTTRQSSCHGLLISRLKTLRSSYFNFLFLII